jgi:hypothetical protein
MAGKSKRASKAAPRRKAAKNGEQPRLSRLMLEKFVADLVIRLEPQVEVAWAIAKVVGPKGEDLVAAVPKLTVLELALNAHASGLQDVLRFLKIIDRRPVLQSPWTLRMRGGASEVLAEVSPQAREALRVVDARKAVRT